MNLLESHLLMLAQDLELPPFPPFNGSASCELSLAPDLKLLIEQGKETFLLYAYIGPCPVARKEEAYSYFMQANLLGQGTGEQVLGMDPSEKSLTLSCTIPYDMNYREFKERIEDFVNYLDYWRFERQKLEDAANQTLL